MSRTKHNIIHAIKQMPAWGKTILLGATLLYGASSALAAPVQTKAGYVVSLGGINIASIKIDFRDNGGDYQIDLGAKVSGVGSLVASGTAAAGSKGHSDNNGLTANDFSLTTRAKGKDFAVAVQFASGDATGFQIEPPLRDNIGRVAIERKHLRDVTDPIGSFILKGDALDERLCDRNIKVFTGMERYDLAMSFAEAQVATSTRTAYQGPVVLCKLRYIPVSGHYKTSATTTYLAQSERILVWYAPLRQTGYYIPYRILLGTSAGDLSVVLTALN